MNRALDPRTLRYAAGKVRITVFPAIGLVGKKDHGWIYDLADTQLSRGLITTLKSLLHNRPVRYGVWLEWAARLILLAIFWGFVPGLRAARQATDVSRQITEAIRSQRYTQAIQLADAALEATPEDAPLWTLKGIALEKAGDLQAAARSFKTALKFSADYLPALEGAAEVAYRLGDDKAQLFLHSVVALKPADPTAHAMLGAIAYKQRDCNSAVLHFDRAQSAVLSNAGALAQYGVCLLIVDRAKEAVEVLTRALQLTPGDKPTLLVLAEAQYATNDTDGAIRTLDPLLVSEPMEPDALALASSAYETLGNTPKAVELLHAAIVASPSNPQYYLDFASLCFSHSSFDVGVDMIDAGLKLLPDSSSLYLARGVLNVQRAKYLEAETDFAKANQLNPAQSLASLAWGLTLVQQDKLESALETAGEEVKKRPDDAFLHYLIAEVLAQRGASPGNVEFQQALHEGEEAVRLNPQFVLAHDTLAGLYLKENRLQAAEHHAREALRLMPSDQIALYHLIQTLRKTGDNKELPDLVKGLAQLRSDAREKEAKQNRYKIFELKPQ